ncbi:MAG: hypothetical protein JWQ66_3888 [Mucilaginibacter sp.]|nr:hypothetical protein [Mucilaginibacter sp.]
MTTNDQDSSSKENERPFINGDRPFLRPPERHGCVTTWLVLMLIVNSLGALAYLFFEKLMEQKLKVSSITIDIIIITAILNAFFSFKLLSWKKIGFYGFFITTIIQFVINFCIKLPLITCILGLCGIVILYGILQIKKGGRSAWHYLK